MAIWTESPVYRPTSWVAARGLARREVSEACDETPRGAAASGDYVPIPP